MKGTRSRGGVERKIGGITGLFVAFAVVLGTLLLQGLTLKPLLAALALRDIDPVAHELASVRKRAYGAALASFVSDVKKTGLTNGEARLLMRIQSVLNADIAMAPMIPL